MRRHDKSDCEQGPTPHCDCGDKLNRRGFAQLASAGAVMSCLGSQAHACPPEATGYRVPEQKNLPEAWLRSLYERGEKEVYSHQEALRRIGMPVGGLFAGTVYLSGDGRLWLWDIFNRDQEGIAPRPFAGPLPNATDDAVLVRNMTRGGHNYLEPIEVLSPFTQAFQMQIAERTIPLDGSAFEHVTFDGRYPIGQVSFADEQIPVRVQLEAFSPFIPLNADDSSLPATVMSYTVENVSDVDVSLTLTGRLQNPVCLETARGAAGELRNRIVQDESLVGLVCSAAATTPAEKAPGPDILFDDFERANYDGWTVEGDAFGSGPIRKKDVPEYQGDVGGEGDRVVNSHATAPGSSIEEKDNRQGSLISRSFTISRRFIQFYLGGGGHPNETCVNLLIDGKAVATASGTNHNRMQQVALDVLQWQGQTGQLQILDQRSGSWGNVGVDQVVFTDSPKTDEPLETRRDFGTMALVMLDVPGDVIAESDERSPGNAEATSALGEPLVGRIGRRTTLGPGEKATFDFVVAWHFPHLTVRDMPGVVVGNHYAMRFPSALEVARYVARNFARLTGTTRRWVETWYDSSLPFWLLDRTMANTSTLATTTCYRFADGRFWAWEGIGCCAGTCTHVWHYAQALGRLFPEIERDQRERIDLGLALKPDGVIGHRAYLDHAIGPAIDGQCGRLLGVYREHCMSTDNRFLTRVWPQVRRALQWLIERDANDDGMIEGAQHNTLDAAWYGKISWLTSLYLAALRAGAAMATEMGDEAFAKRCQRIAEHGSRSILETFNGEYFVQLEDPAHRNEIATGNGCHIDQVFGQTWAHWVGLGRLFDREKQLSALRALWKYNFVPDVGPYREENTRGRWYAVGGDAGLVMCTWPHTDQNRATRSHWQFGYFNECMSGFEWQVAAHMIWESLDQPDLLEKGLAISRAIHDRYNGTERNPYNEIECSDHYARAMASYGVFQAVCGFHCHGPRGEFRFAPRLTPADFKAAFVGPAGWGSITQRVDAQAQQVEIEVHYGELTVETLVLHIAGPLEAVRRVLDGQANELQFVQSESEVTTRLPSPVQLHVGDQFKLHLLG
ncbi:MAG: hypothetical protein KDA60_15470 [Planctomycetales bacterium]|nr:hypothetical protein [Planctomycetales bacterium]